MTEGVASDHADAWAAFAYPEPETLQDYLESVPGDWVCFDELTLKQQWDQFLEEAREQSADVLRTGVLVPPPNQLFRWDTAADLRLKERTRLYLDQLALTDAADVGVANVEEPENLAKPGQPSPPKARHAVQVRENGELAASGPKNAFAQLLPRLALWKQQGFRIVVACGTESQAERARFLLQENGHAARIGAAPEPGQIVLTLTSLPEGFRWPAEGIVLLAEHELFGTRQARKAARRPRSESGSAAQDWSGLQALADLSVNDAVVHSEHGIGLYRGLVRLELSGAPADFLQLEYAGKDRLYLPVYRLNVLQKYVGSGEAAPLDRLGSQQFAKAKEKVRDAVRTLAIDLVKLYAERAMRPGERFGPRDPEYGEFEARFAFEETPDQLRAIETVLDDLESGRPMDRLVCGDVGYGKTEVAMRAAYRAVSEGKQVAVLVPTTILAHQHEQSFRARFRDTPVQIDSVSRFKTAKDQKEVLRALADGKLDIVIGTHRLLSRDVAFRNLGLVIVDEEHRFGVEHKERLKALKVNTHVLTLTATPIPRTLHMALSGLRDISIINTPPVDRLPIRTFVSRYDESLIQRAIAFELGRGGQVFFLHNRVQTIHQTAETLTRLVPHARVGIAHGQMAESELENAMLAFYRRETQVLVCTTIIESGIDVPSANTLIVSRADALGLAQLYQIRGRVGRGQQRAYAYLLIPPEAAISTDARKRLEVLQKFVELGAGFSVASHDLEIRGGGDLLGPQQSGHIAAVGFDLYTQLLEEAIAELRTETGKTSSATTKPNEPEIKVPFPAFLSEEYIPDVHQRLSLYRRLSAAEDEATLDRLEAELGDRFGRLPEPASNLLWLIRIKQWLKSTGIDSLSAGRERVSLVSSGAGSRLNPARAIALVASRPADFQLTPDSKFVAKIPTDGIKELYFGLLALGKLLA